MSGGSVQIDRLQEQMQRLKLVRMAADRLSVRWYLGYGLAEPLPDLSTLSRPRERYGLETFRRFFDAMKAGNKVVAI